MVFHREEGQKRGVMFRRSCRGLLCGKECTLDNGNDDQPQLERDGGRSAGEEVNNELRSSNSLNNLGHQSFHTKTHPHLTFTRLKSGSVLNCVCADIFYNHCTDLRENDGCNCKFSPTVCKFSPNIVMTNRWFSWWEN